MVNKLGYGSSCNSLEDKTSDLLRLYYAIILGCSYSIENTQFHTNMASQDILNSDFQNENKGKNILSKQTQSIIGLATISLLLYKTFSKN